MNAPGALWRRGGRVLVLLLALTACQDQPSGDAAQALVLEARAQVADEAAGAANEWRHYLGDAASNQYSPLADIHRGNVAGLREAWRYDPGDAGDFDTFIPTNPLIVRGVLYGLSARKNLFALNAATGEELWVHRFNRPHDGKGSGRGLVYWQGTLPDGETVEWLLVGLGHDLFAIDALSGKTATAFGERGRVDLRVGLDRPVEDLQVNVIAPGTLYGDLLIQGFGTSEFYGAAPGYIRAYRLPGGSLQWTFRTIPAPGEPGADTWPQAHRDEFGGANSWAGITVDEARGLAFVPTGSAAFDFYGKNRHGDNLYANSLLALDAASGERVWHYQIVRHDLWDRDLPSPPNLITLTRSGEAIPAVSQATKTGHLFVFHRETGEPLYPVRQVPVTGPGVPGEFLPPSQPLPTRPPPFARQHFSVTDISEASAAYVSQQVKGKALNEPFRAPDEAGQVIYPGLDGGAEWGGQAYDADSGLLFVNTSEVPWHFSLVPTHGDTDKPFSLAFAYTHYCGGCHGKDRAGNGDIFPSLRDIADKYWPWEVYDIVRNGRGRMPAFSHEPWYYLLGPIAYLYTAGDD
ncbi:MAG: PQQ-binding-like beta-propeller repeat protein, partial [Halioglobus sp.]|nr:PQQ-binding-like beta-propeller repeat protein [Halioglobus sp.]